MYPLIAAGIVGLAAMVAAHDWRRGIYFVVVAGLLQDIFRKLTPGIPSYYLLWSAAIFGISVLFAFSRNALPRARILALGDRRIQTYGRWLGIVIALQAAHALIRWGSPALPMIGLVFYVAPVVGMLVGASFVRDERQIARFMIVYVAVMFPAVLTIYLSPGYQDFYPVLREIGSFVGVQMIIYDVGTKLLSYSGVFRVGEIASWHAGVACMFLIVLAVRRPSLIFRAFAGLAVIAMIGAIIYTGRRKMLMVLVIFAILFAGGLLITRRGGGRFIVTGMVLALVGSYGFTLFSSGDESSLYLTRSTSVFSTAGERVESAINLLLSAFGRSSGIGMGVGVAAQGAQYAGGSEGLVGGSGEAGIGKIMVELGIPGFVLFVLLLFRLAKRVLFLISHLGKRGASEAYWAMAFGAILVANVAAFTVAAQLFGDPFILILLGLLAGMMFRFLREGALKAQVSAVHPKKDGRSSGRFGAEGGRRLQVPSLPAGRVRLDGAR